MELAANISLSGGNTKFPNFDKRSQSLLRDVYCLRSYRRHRARAVSHVGACVAHHTEQVWSTGFHSGSNAYYITPRSQT